MVLSEHEKKSKKDEKSKESDVYDKWNEQDVNLFRKTKNENAWWNKSNYDKKTAQETHSILKGNPDISKTIQPGGKEVADIPHQMGSFETKTVGTVMVGFDRYNKKGDLGFTVLSNTDKIREGTPERDENHPNTYFGGNFDGKEKPFEAGKIAFRYDRKTKEIDKIQNEHNESPIDDEENLLYKDEKEESNLERLRKEKMSRPNEVVHLSKQEMETKKIRDNKRKENDDFLKEIKIFIRDLKNGRIKLHIESDELATRRKRIIELSSNLKIFEEIKEEIRKEISNMNGQRFDDKALENIVADFLMKTKFKGLDKGEFSKIIKDLEKEVLR